MGRTMKLVKLGCINCVTIGCKLSLQVVGYMCIVLAGVLITCVVYEHCTFTIPILTQGRSGLHYAVHLLLLIATSFGVWFNYIMALLVPPGRPLADDRDSNREMEEGEVDAVIPGSRKALTRLQRITTTGGRRDPANPWSDHCRRCDDAYKPPRAHHCPMCGECVLKMDHHCPWINCCVGYYNQRYFMLFLLYLLLGTAYIGTTMLLVAMHILPTSLGPHYRFGSNLLFLFVLVLCWAILVAMLFFVGWSGYMVLSNQTSIEYQFNRDLRTEIGVNHSVVQGHSTSATVWRNPYDVGRHGNLAQVFAVAGRTLPRAPVLMWLSVLLPTVRPMPSDGYTFDTWDSDMFRRVPV
jgi:hypothetical protein